MTPGWKTTEFWLSILALLSTVLPQVAPIAGAGGPVLVAAGAGLAAVYTASRSYVKAKEVQAVAAAPDEPLPPFRQGPPT